MLLIQNFDLSSRQLLIQTIVMLSFLGLNIIPSGIYGLHHVFTIVLLLWVIKYKHVCFFYKKMILFYLFFVFCSCCYSYFFNGQPLLKTFGFCYDFLGLLYAFYILGKRYTYIQIEKVLIALSVLFCIGYFLQWLVFPFPLYSKTRNITNLLNESYYRLRLPCSFCSIIIFYYGINKILIEKRLCYILYSILGFFPIMMMGFRVMNLCVIGGALCMFALVTKKFVLILKYMFFFIFFIFFITKIDIVSHKINEMKMRTERDQLGQNDDYIRYREYDYFTEDVFVKAGEQFFGGGVPAGKTTYALRLSFAAQNYAFYWMDLGLIGLSWLIGIPAVFMLILIYLTCALRATACDIQYIRFSMLVVFACSLVSSMELYRTGNILVASLLLCAEIKYNDEFEGKLKT